MSERDRPVEGPSPVSSRDSDATLTEGAREMEAEQRPRVVMGSKEKLRLIVQVILLAMFVWATVEAFEYRDLARYMPVLAGGLGIIATTLGIVVDQVRYRRGVSAAVATLGEATLFTDRAEIKSWWDWPLVRALRYIGWLLVFATAIFFIDLIYVAPVFVAAFFALEAKVVWWKALLYGVAALGLVYILSEQIGLATP